jgi:hypothetical protein
MEMKLKDALNLFFVRVRELFALLYVRPPAS